MVKISKIGNQVLLQCESKGWYPQPEVLWLDGEGNVLSAGPAETVRDPDDLFSVSSRVTVEKRHNNRFTCRVQQKNINQTRETHIHVTGRERVSELLMSLLCYLRKVEVCFLNTLCVLPLQMTSSWSSPVLLFVSPSAWL